MREYNKVSGKENINRNSDLRAEASHTLTVCKCRATSNEAIHNYRLKPTIARSDEYVHMFISDTMNDHYWVRRREKKG